MDNVELTSFTKLNLGALYYLKHYSFLGAKIFPSKILVAKTS